MGDAGGVQRVDVGPDGFGRDLGLRCSGGCHVPVSLFVQFLISPNADAHSGVLVAGFKFKNILNLNPAVAFQRALPTYLISEISISGLFFFVKNLCVCEFRKAKRVCVCV